MTENEGNVSITLLQYTLMNCIFYRIVSYRIVSDNLEMSMFLDE